VEKFATAKLLERLKIRGDAKKFASQRGANKKEVKRDG
jgi:hypothetical protein